MPQRLVGVYDGSGGIREVSDTNGYPVKMTGENPDGSINVIETGSDSFKGSIQNITTAGTRVQLPNYPCREVTIIAKKSNTGSIFVGGNDVSSTVYGCELESKDSITIKVSNTNLIYLDSSVSGEGVSYVAI